MDNKRTRRFLIVAFALSLLIHLILTGVIRWPFRLANDDVQTVTIEHLHTVRIAHMTPPPHTPAPKRVPVHLAKTTAFNPKSSLTEGTVVTGTPVAASTAPTPTPTPNCATNDTPVQIIASAPPPDIPPAARADRKSGIIRVRVSVNPQGNIENATVVESSGSAPLDQVALAMAHNIQYAPATHDCRAVLADYTYSVKFVAW
jgi:periplasmic protein TonB